MKLQNISKMVEIFCSFFSSNCLRPSTSKKRKDLKIFSELEGGGVHQKAGGKANNLRGKGACRNFN